MAYNQHLAERIERVLKDKGVNYAPKKMFGGIAYMVNDKMCVGIVKENLMLRVNPDNQDQLLRREGCRPMDFTHRPMKGFIYVEPMAIDMDEDLAEWVQFALDYNPLAKKSK